MPIGAFSTKKMIGLMLRNLCIQYLQASVDKEDYERRMERVRFERELFVYAYGTDGYWERIVKVKEEL